MQDVSGAAQIDWQRIQQCFHEALDQPTGEREAFVERTLSGEPALRAEVLSLLTALDAGDERFDSPLLDLTTTTTTSLAPGTDVGMWTVLRKIGEGGMATVYEAIRRDADMPKRAALKTVRTISHPALRARFARERRILATLEHPNIAALLDGGTLPDGRPWLAMEYVEGQRIDHWCFARQLDVRARVRLLLQICRAVEAAHERNVVHRDLKPTNILVNADGTVKLLDFGIAKLAEDVERHDTATGALMMTADYASPEQLRGDRITARSDIYSLGVIAFELLTGLRPFAMRGQGLRDLMRLADTEAPKITQVISELSARTAGFPDSTRLRAALRGDLEAVIAKALQKDAGARYASARDLADDLVAWLESRPVSAHPPSLLYRTQRMMQRNRHVVAPVLALVAITLVTLAGVSWQARRADEEQRRAERRLEEVRTLVRTLVYDVNDRLADVPGSTELRANVVRTAVQSLDNATAEAPRHPQLLRELAMAYQRAGDLLGNPTENNLGDAAGALEVYAKGRGLAEQLVRLAPDNPDALWTLALTLEKTADVTAPAGSIDDAVTLQQQSFDLFSQIAAMDSTNPNFVRAVGISSLKLGDLLGHPAFANKGDMDAAVAAYRIASERLAMASQLGDSSTFTRRHQAVVQERLGRLMQERSDFAAARRWLRGSLEMRMGLMRENMSSPQARRDVAISYYLLCGMHIEEGDLASARDTCGESLAIRRALLLEDPRNGVLIRGMGIMHRRLAEVHMAAADTAQAFREFADARLHYVNYLEGRTGALNDRRDFAQLLLEFVAAAAPSTSSHLRAEARHAYELAVASLDSIGKLMPLGADDSTRVNRAKAALFDQ